MVWIIPRALALHVYKHATKLALGWGQRSISRMMIKYVVKVFDASIYTPGNYAEGYIVFALTFVRSFVTFRHVRRIYLKVFA